MSSLVTRATLIKIKIKKKNIDYSPYNYQMQKINFEIIIKCIRHNY